MDLVLPNLEVNIGEDFELNLEFINRSDQRRTIDVYISGSVVYYTGVTSSEFLFRDPTVTIGPSKSEYGLYLLICRRILLRSQEYVIWHCFFALQV